MTGWDAISELFEWDGSWRDICVLNTTQAEWQAVWELLLTLTPAIRLTVDGNQIEPPTNVSGVLKEIDVLVRLELGNLTIYSNVFTEDEIEFDLDPRTVRDLATAQSLAGFMRDIGDRIRKEVLLTEESAHDQVLATYNPRTRKFRWATSA